MMVAAVDDAREADAALVRAAAAGDRAAFARVYDAHRRSLHRLAYGIVLDADDAREAVQEAFARLHAIAPRWEPDARVGTWLHRVVVNHCLGLRRRMLRVARAMLVPSTADTPEKRA